MKTIRANLVIRNTYTTPGYLSASCSDFLQGFTEGPGPKQEPSIHQTSVIRVPDLVLDQMIWSGQSFHTPPSDDIGLAADFILAFDSI